MTTGILPDQNLEKEFEKQMGCMAGFLQIFDRQQILTGKSLYSTKRLPPTPASDSTNESEKGIGSPAILRELEKPHHHQQQQQGKSIPSPDRFKKSPVTELRSPSPLAKPVTPLKSDSKMALPLPVFEFKEGTRSSRRFCKEAPRLSLDSRAIVDAKGSLKPKEIRTKATFLSANRCGNAEEAAVGEAMETQRRSTSVIARLMGLESLPNSDPEPAKKAELRRSASESRVSKDQYRFIDGINFQLKQSPLYNSQVKERQNQNNAAREERMGYVDPKQFNVRNVRGEPAKAPQRGIVQKKSYYDSADFFPEPRQSVSIYGEIEKRLKMRGVDEPSKNLETLKQILEALQLKGLLHPTKPPSQALNLGNFVYDESPIVVMKPGTVNKQGSAGNSNDSSFPSSFRRAGPRRILNFSGEKSPAVSPRLDRSENDRNVRSQSSPSRGQNSNSPARNEIRIKSPSGRRPLCIDTQRKVNKESTEQRRVSPRIDVRRIGSDQTTNRSPRLLKPTAEICHKDDEVSTISESSRTTYPHSQSQTDTERSKVEEYKEGRSLLERCDKLLQSIAEITASELQPSPVSVLDSSFYKEESSPSPVMKRSIDFKADQQMELEDDNWSLGFSSVESKSEDDDCDFIYISDILRASNYLHEDTDLFLLLEKHQYLKGKDTSKVSRLQRKLIFDTINEILNRRRKLLPWKVVSYANSNSGQASLQQIWSEYCKIRERHSSEDLFNVICGVLKKELEGAVLDIERLIFKDLICETIRDLAAISGKCNPAAAVPSRRKLIF